MYQNTLLTNNNASHILRVLGKFPGQVLLKNIIARVLLVHTIHCTTTPLLVPNVISQDRPQWLVVGVCVILTPLLTPNVISQDRPQWLVVGVCVILTKNTRTMNKRRIYYLYLITLNYQMCEAQYNY